MDARLAPATLTPALLDSLSAECDFDGIGACPAGPPPVPADPDPVALALAMPEDLRYVHRGIERRLDPGLVLPGARSVVVAYVSYLVDHPGQDDAPPGCGGVSRFAWCEDYHRTVGARMRKLSRLLEERHGVRSRGYVDTGPVYEKAWAAAAGLGFIGKHTLLVTPRHGSWVFLAVLVTDAPCDVPPGGPATSCGDCDACRRACPTGALERPWILDASRCLAHLTASARGPIPGDLHDRLDGRLYGCDACQEACPRNRHVACPDRTEFRPLPGVAAPDLAALDGLDEAGFLARFGPTPIRRRGLDGLRATARLLAKREKGPC